MSALSEKAVTFTPQFMERFKATVAKYEQPASALLPTLYLAQEQFGYLTQPILDYVASLLGVPAVQAYEAVSFYSMFRKQDMGKYCLQVCNNVTCTMMGSEQLLKVIHEETGLKPGDVGKDKKFSVVAVQCLGSCDTAPVIQVNEDYEENLNPEKLRKLIRELGGRA